jgi:NhaC family Na+:H+ antiporter
MIVKKIPALPVLMAGVLLGIICAFLFQNEIITQIGSNYDETGNYSYTGVMITLFGSTSIESGNETLNELLSSNGMSGMLMTIWLILSALTFGGVMEASGFLARIIHALIAHIHSAASLVRATVGTCLFANVTTSDQYLAVLLPGRMFGDVYKERGLASQNLSRTLEDSGTVTSVLVPWNTCGAFHAGVLGVSTFTYAPFTFFCLISPFMTMYFAYRGIRIARIDSEE